MQAGMGAATAWCLLLLPSLLPLLLSLQWHARTLKADDAMKPCHLCSVAWYVSYTTSLMEACGSSSNRFMIASMNSSALKFTSRCGHKKGVLTKSPGLAWCQNVYVQILFRIQGR
jgi:hypothetical protein